MNEKLRYPHLYGPSDGYVFIVTYGRSGSTLLMKILNAIDGACIRGENNDCLEPLLRSIHRVESSNNITSHRQVYLNSKQSADDSIQNTPSDPWYGAERISLDDYARTVLDAFVSQILHPKSDTRLLGFKEIRYIDSKGFFQTQMEYMLKFFPNSRIIFLTRDPREVANSGWWRQQDMNAVIERINRADQRFHRFLENNKQSCFHFDYAMYSEGFEAINKLLSFLGEEVDRQTIEEILSTRLDHAQTVPGQ